VSPSAAFADHFDGHRLRLIRKPARTSEADGSVGGVEVMRIADGLWRWTTAHPEWRPGGGWDEEVGCVYWEADDAVVLVDPLVPIETGERSRFLDALDRDVERVGRPVVVLLTCEWHERSAAELSERYGGRTQGRGPGRLPTGVVAVSCPSAHELVYWLEGPGAVVCGDVLLGRESSLALCPESWIESGTRAELARELRPLLDLPVERVLTSHGAPVLARGGDALTRVLAPA